MPKLHRARLTGAHISAGLGLIALLSACGGQPEAANNAAAVVDNAAVANVTNNVAEPVANETAAPANSANAAEAPAPKETPTPTPTPTPVALKAEAPAAPGGDAAAGAKLFAQCKVCHSVEPGKNGLGPSLFQVVGRKSATEAGYTYSPAMKGSGLTWTDATLSDYLRAPMKKVPGTKMAFGGIADDKNRADVIAYLDTLK